MSAERVFVDTSVLAYLFDDSEPKKQRRARERLAGERREIFVSTQVLQELYVALTKGRGPLRRRISPRARSEDLNGGQIIDEIRVDNPFL